VRVAVQELCSEWFLKILKLYPYDATSKKFQVDHGPMSHTRAEMTYKGYFYNLGAGKDFRNIPEIIKARLESQAWWCTSLIPALRRRPTWANSKFQILSRNKQTGLGT
jgi:hypothetical protein